LAVVASIFFPFSNLATNVTSVLLPKSCEQPYRTEQQSAYGTPSNRAFKSFNAVLIRTGDLRDIVEVIETAGVISPWEVNQSRIDVRVRDSSTRITSVNVDLGHWAVWPFGGARQRQPTSGQTDTKDASQVI
jgi:hypothetical protein